MVASVASVSRVENSCLVCSSQSWTRSGFDMSGIIVLVMLYIRSDDQLVWSDGCAPTGAIGMTSARDSDRTRMSDPHGLIRSLKPEVHTEAGVSPCARRVVRVPRLRDSAA